MTAREGNHISLLETGDEFFPSLEAAIDHATREVHIETYIFADDAIGRRIAQTIARAAQRGVVARVLIDGYGSNHLAPALSAVLLAAGVQILIYRPSPKRFSLYRDHLRRLHRKLVVIDGRLAFCGGINLKDDRDNAGTDPPRYDFSVKVEGPLVGDMHRAARRLWLMTELRNLTHSGHSRMRRSLPPPALPNGQLAQFLTRDNWLNRRRIEDAYVVAVQSAAREIVIANAYFLPGRRIRHALLAAASRGVRVRLLLQGRPDHLLIYYATQALYVSLIKGGIEIFEYSPAHLHAKVAVVDDHWATVGSSNIDPFSLWLCREANVIVHDLTLVETLRKSLALAIAERSQPITLDITNHRSCYERLRAWAIYRLGRFLIGLTGFATRDEL